MEQKWRKYAPVGKDTKHDHKMHLRNMVSIASIFGIPMKCVQKGDYGDDIYVLNVPGEEVNVVAREKGQTAHTEGIFDEMEFGIFYRVTDENERAAESELVKAFK